MPCSRGSLLNWLTHLSSHWWVYWGTIFFCLVMSIWYLYKCVRNILQMNHWFCEHFHSILMCGKAKYHKYSNVVLLCLYLCNNFFYDSGYGFGFTLLDLTAPSITKCTSQNIPVVCETWNQIKPYNDIDLIALHHLSTTWSCPITHRRGHVQTSHYFISQ